MSTSTAEPTPSPVITTPQDFIRSYLHSKQAYAAAGIHQDWLVRASQLQALVEIGKELLKHPGIVVEHTRVELTSIVQSIVIYGMKESCLTTKHGETYTIMITLSRGNGINPNFIVRNCVFKNGKFIEAESYWKGIIAETTSATEAVSLLVKRIELAKTLYQ